MSAPAGVKANRWNTVVSKVASKTGMTTTDADTWLNALWSDMHSGGNGDEIAGNLAAHDQLKTYLESVQVAPTLTVALRQAVS